jgi:methylmalonyl-CoA/ethylmalonyl-CoA epimerase
MAFAVRPHHCGLSVPDLDATIAWYQDIFGFVLEKREYIPPAHADIAFLRLGDFRLEIFQVEDAKPLPAERRVPNEDLRTHGTKHLCFEVDDLAAIVPELKAKGVDFAMDHRPMGKGSMAFIRDNSGILIELLDKF